jgi:hypothetical protein
LKEEKKRELKIKILKYANVNWRVLRTLQNENFKTLYKKEYDKLKASLLKNNFIEPFRVWQKEDEMYCLDGYHRKLILQDLLTDGYAIPEMLPAIYVDCKNKKQAAQFVLVFSSQYAKVSDQGLYEFVTDYKLGFDDFGDFSDLPYLDLEAFKVGYMDNDENKSALTDGNYSGILDGSPGGRDMTNYVLHLAFKMEKSFTVAINAITDGEKKFSGFKQMVLNGEDYMPTIKRLLGQ